jgi:hypothetical protein
MLKMTRHTCKNANLKNYYPETTQHAFTEFFKDKTISYVCMKKEYETTKLKLFFSTGEKIVTHWVSVSDSTLMQWIQPHTHNWNAM